MANSTEVRFASEAKCLKKKCHFTCMESFLSNFRHVSEENVDIPDISVPFPLSLCPLSLFIYET